LKDTFATGTIVIVTTVITIIITINNIITLIVDCTIALCSIVIQVSPQSEGVINLAEIEIWNGGSKVPNSALSAEMSTTYPAPNGVSACFDGNYNTMCHTLIQCCGSLTITISGVIFDTIKVINRQEGINLTYKYTVL